MADVDRTSVVLQPQSDQTRPVELPVSAPPDSVKVEKRRSKEVEDELRQSDSLDAGSLPKAATEVIDSEIGVPVLLGRLKQSITSASEFSLFLKRRSVIEETHAKELQKLSKNTRESSGRKEGRQGSHVSSIDGMLNLYDNMAENGLQFAYSLHTMYENLSELSSKLERQRKHWKHVSSQAEKKVKDAEALALKAKTKYNSMADEYELVKTGDKSAGRHFFRQHNEDELRPKVEAAQTDYASKVEIAQNERRELVNTHRPSAVNAIKELVAECDAGLDLQLQKFATFNEKLALSNGMLLCPIKDPSSTSQPLGLAGIMSQTNSCQDFLDYVLEHREKMPPPTASVQYEQHRALASTNQAALHAIAPNTLPNSMSSLSFAQSAQHPPTSPPSVKGSRPYTPMQPELPGPRAPNNLQMAEYSPQYASQNNAPGSFPYSQSQPPYPPSYAPGPTVPASTVAPPEDPQLNPNRVFNISLSEYCEGAQEYVPVLVTQCIEAIKERGIETPGLYVSPLDSTQMKTIHRLVDMFMTVNDTRPIVTWANPAPFDGDVFVLAELICYWLEQLPEPLIDYPYQPDCFSSITSNHPILLHKTINDLPNPHYATLHRITYHLRCVAGASPRSGSSTEALAARFGPLFMRPRNKIDTDLSTQVVATIINKWDDFFELDED